MFEFMSSLRLFGDSEFFFRCQMLRPCGPCVPFFAVILFPFLVILFVLITTFSLVFGIFCAVPASMGCCCLYSWRCSKRWQTDLYQKVIYLSYYLQNRGLPQPKANSKFLPVEDIRPKQVLESLGETILGLIHL